MQEEPDEKRKRKKGIGEWKRTGRTMRWEKERDRYHGNAPCELFFKVAFWEEEYCLAHCTVAEANTLPP